MLLLNLIKFSLLRIYQIFLTLDDSFSIVRKSKKIQRSQSRVFKNCILCESWIRFKAPVCKECRRYLYLEFKKNRFKILNIDNYPCCYLWEWNSQNHIWIQKIILSMKDGDNLELYKLLMPWLFKKMILNHLCIESIKNMVAIPSFDRYHPEALANVFLQIKPEVGWFKIIKKDFKSQKQKSRSDRLRTEFDFDDKFRSLNSPISSIKNVLVLDDVISTGGSFRGVLSLLGPRKVHIAAAWAYKVPRINITSNETFKTS